jgi:pyrroline-5-carboxylate reductase
VKIAVIGGGNMGMAFAEGVARGSAFGDWQISIVEPDENRRREFANSNRFEAIDSISSLTGTYDVVFLAIKPQVVTSLYREIKSIIASDTLVISVMAGITLQAMQEGLSHKRVVRAMPNLPARVGCGMSVACLGAGVPAEQRVLTESILSAAGAVIVVQSEDLLDAATAVSGSGPGFVFYLIEHFQQIATELGFSSEQSELLVQQTFEGTLELLKSSPHSASELREQVTSKGGTTEAGLNSFKESTLGPHLQEGVRAAFKRCRELGKG